MILHIALNTGLRRHLDYLAPIGIALNALKIGTRVRVPFRSKTTVGILVGFSSKSSVPNEKLKHAIELLDQEPLFSKNLFEVLQWASEYYQHPIGEVCLAALPTLLRKGRVLKKEDFPVQKELIKSHTILELNSDQKQVVQTVSESIEKFGVYLLHGVTGSGKTEVYWRLIQETIQNQKQVLILVPEIGLAPQLTQHLQNKLHVKVVVIHSGLTEKARLDAWLQARSGAPVIVGTRSAIFTPLIKPGLIIIDEEHDLSFKQQEGFRYSARDVAIIRAKKENIPIILGSATPSLESLLNVQKQRYVELKLPNRAGDSLMPHFHIVDVRAKSLKHGISSVLLEAMEKHLAASQQVLLFINRRGYAPVLLCHSCGWIAHCQRCDARLTLHQAANYLMCHHCGFSRAIHSSCQSCSSADLLQIGLGTERVETILKKHFPNHRIARIDRDTTRKKDAMTNVLDSVKEGSSQILIGTQMIAKGHHFPKVTLVGVLDMDGGFFSSDFRATERMAQLLIQVAGRAGREANQGEVYLQTHQPDHPLLIKLLSEGYSTFAQALLTERQQTHLPPFSYLALFRAESVKENEPMHFLKQVAQEARHAMGEHIDILGPIPSPMQKKAGHYRSQLLLRSSQRMQMNEGLRQLLNKLEALKLKSRVRWSVDVDPLEMF